jgi:hypothetical protein
MNRLDIIEKQIKSLFENTVHSDRWAKFVHILCQYFQNSLIVSTGSTIQLPTDFRIYLNAEDMEFWKKQNDWQSIVTNIYQVILAEYGFNIQTSPTFNIFIKNSLAPGELLITPTELEQIKGKTDAVPLSQISSQNSCHLLEDENPILIFNNGDTIKVNKTVINIGRKSTNDIVIDDLRISRTHAQIRKFQSDYTIFDVGSTSGVYINGERTSHHTLRSGDVISLGGYTILFSYEMKSLQNNRIAKTTQISTSRVDQNK